MSKVTLPNTHKAQFIAFTCQAIGKRMPTIKFSSGGRIVNFGRCKSESVICSINLLIKYFKIAVPDRTTGRGRAFAFDRSLQIYFVRWEFQFCV